MGFFSKNKKSGQEGLGDNQLRIGFQVYTLEENFLRIRTETKKGKLISEDSINYGRINSVNHRNAGPGANIVEINVADEKKSFLNRGFMYKKKVAGDLVENFIEELNKKLN